MKKTSIFILTIMMILLLAGCGKQNLEIASDVQPNIDIEQGGFDISPEKCIEILNQDLEAANLPLISKDYTCSITDMAVENGEGKKFDEKSVTTYDAEITDEISLRFILFESLDYRIPVIEVIYTENADTGKHKDDLDKLHKYFEVVSQNIEPEFNAHEFTINTIANEHYRMDNVSFWCGTFNRGESEKAYIYLITTNEELFPFYLN